MGLSYGLAVTLLLVPALPGQGPGEFQRRRTELRKRLEPGQAIVLVGETGREADLQPSGFRQGDNFFYLTGMTEAGGALVITQDGGETLFGNAGQRQGSDSWNAVPAGLQAAGTAGGIANLSPMGALDQAVEALGGAVLSERDTRSLIHQMRRYKSAAEIELLRKAIDITCAAHREVMRSAQAGMYEYQLQSILEHVFFMNGAERVGFASIVGSGPNTTVLHWSANTRKIGPNDVVVVDIGAEYGMYTADVTRTIPISGKFTARQRSIYEIVLAANQAGIAMVAPGVAWREITAKVDDILMEGLVEVGLMESKDRRALRQYYYHGLGHGLGLNVHDVGGLGTLEAGMVLTIEPGLYIREEAMGFRIEDDILVTETGHELLTASAPKTVGAIEGMMEESGMDFSRYMVIREK
jgi:Xaa-Pro aminopeptidase